MPALNTLPKPERGDTWVGRAAQGDSGWLGQMLTLLRRGVLSGQLPLRAAASTRLLPPSTLRVALCSSSSGNAGGGNGGDGNGEKKPPPAVAEADADADADMELYDETETEGALQKYDPDNISTMPPVVVFPFATRPIFPGIFQPCEVIDPRLVAALTAAKASHHPYVGVFLPKDKGEGMPRRARTPAEQTWLGLGLGLGLG